MKFFLMRHGEAEHSASSDAKRHLTTNGIKSVRGRVNQYSEDLSEIDLIIHSPYLRTIQTSEIIADSLNLSSALVESALWTPDSDPLVALESLAHHSQSTPIIVTHMPLISIVEALCCEGVISYPRSFSCAEIAEITADWPAAGLGSLIRRF